MFDRNTLMLGHGAAYPAAGPRHVTIEEKRAPTDESVRLLREMEAAAQKNILATVRLEGCPVDCVVHHQRNTLTDDHEFIVLYRLGSSKRIEVRHNYRYRSSDNPHEARQRLVDELVAAVADSIARQILSPAMNSAISASKFGFR